MKVIKTSSDKPVKQRKHVKQKKKKTITDESSIKILILCFQQEDFCQKAAITLTPKPNSSESMRKTYESLTAIFSSLGRTYEIITNWICCSLDLDLSTEKRKIILEKINSLMELDDPQRKKCMKEISSLLTNAKQAE